MQNVCNYLSASLFSLNSFYFNDVNDKMLLIEVIWNVRMKTIQIDF